MPGWEDNTLIKISTAYTGYFKRILFLVSIMVCSSCYKEDTVKVSFISDVQLVMEKEQEDAIYNTFGQAFEITNPKPGLVTHDNIIEIKRLKIKGHSSLNYRRKNFDVKLYSSIKLIDENLSLGYKQLKRFELVSMVLDYTYIENYLAYQILGKIGLWKLYYRYSEVFINDSTFGLYIIVEDPEQYALDKANCEFILRRNYKAEIDNYEYEPLGFGFTELDYIDKFNSIYTDIVNYSGTELLSKLKSKFMLENYMRKMAFDLLVKNGDTSDEVFFFAVHDNDSIKFEIIPWDFDDIFDGYPHEIGREWYVGDLFGDRKYNSYEDIYKDIGDKLIFSIEDDLDYIIAMDDTLYNRYLEQLKVVLTSIDEQFINDIFAKTLRDLDYYYNKPEIINQSLFDDRPTDRSLLLENLENKKQLLINRRATILNKINTN